MASAAGLTTAQVWISGFGDAASFALVIAPAFTFLRIKKTGLIGNVDVLPFIFTLFNCLMWVADSIPNLHQSMPILIINAVGSLLELIWVILFIYYSSGTKRCVAVFSLLATVVASAIVFYLTFTKVKQKKWSPVFLGYLAAGSGVAMYLLPLWSTAKMWKLKDGGDLNPLMMVSSLANGGLWCAFAKVGRRRVNWFIMVPNINAIFSATVQFFVWAYLLRMKPPVLPVVAPNQAQGSAVGREGAEGSPSRAGAGEENLQSQSQANQRQQPNDLRANEAAASMRAVASSSSAIVTAIEMATGFGSCSPSKPGSAGALSKPASRASSSSPSKSGSGALSKPASRASSRSPSKSGSPSGSRASSKPGSPSGSRASSKSGSPSGSRASPKPGLPSGASASSQSGTRALSKPVSPSGSPPSRSSSASDTQQPPVMTSSSPPTPSPTETETQDETTDQ